MQQITVFIDLQDQLNMFPCAKQAKSFHETQIKYYSVCLLIGHTSRNAG
jgi:hypothetical protein